MHHSDVEGGSLVEGKALEHTLKDWHSKRGWGGGGEGGAGVMGEGVRERGWGRGGRGGGVEGWGLVGGW